MAQAGRTGVQILKAQLVCVYARFVILFIYDLYLVVPFQAVKIATPSLLKNVRFQERMHPEFS